MANLISISIFSNIVPYFHKSKLNKNILNVTLSTISENVYFAAIIFDCLACKDAKPKFPNPPTRSNNLHNDPLTQPHSLIRPDCAIAVGPVTKDYKENVLDTVLFAVSSAIQMHTNTHTLSAVEFKKKGVEGRTTVI